MRRYDRFNLGDKVTWRTQSNGYWKTKEGEIIGIVPEICTPKNYQFIPEQYHNLPFRYGGGGFRYHESYIVLCTKLNGVEINPILYWPRVNTLKLKDGVGDE